MNFTDLQLRDIAMIFYVVAFITPILVSVLIWVINRYLKKQDVKENKIDAFIDVVSNNLTELKVITEVHESEIERLKKDVEATFMIKYNKGK